MSGKKTYSLERYLKEIKRVDSIDFKRHFYLIRSNSLVQARDRRSLQKKADGARFMETTTSPL